ncbi:hypothetical protein C2I06_15785 [Niallia circulans]|uniref:UDP-N-acetylmuramoyl-tripeptide--D-alanyl-D- alanine ligase n=1 Tax=Niallia circulans TaxID=1397 RepID=UPI000F45BFEC|nr:UDP-N-acetylmuramoyl-tripeptide--D-alanyl-D-alanine ligase [Niallia circulans]AYV68207.1 hypothetical protein C2I06_15785 [Niallia circulans]AYV73397.1 hypothetical protein C2H98_18565 [Niallia circulans]
MQGFSSKELATILEGYYIKEVDNFHIFNFEIDPKRLESEKCDHTCFISVSKKRWELVHKKETQWRDGNREILDHYLKCAIIITEEPIKELIDEKPQLIVKDSYKTIAKLAKAARLKMNNPVIAITGSVGKSSTRLLLEHLLKGDGTIVATRGNHNTQVGVPLYGSKLSSNPDYGIIEISLNALNNRGNHSLTIQPDICLVTSIGEAHLSTLHSTENIAKFKARIFKGMQQNGIAIINHDIGKKEFDILYHAAKEKTEKIYTYSLSNKNADLYLKKYKQRKYDTLVTFHYQNQDYCFSMKLPSNGMIANAFGAILCLAKMGHPFTSYLEKLQSFKSLDKIMDLKTYHTADGRLIDVIDDTHNAAIPSMINAIQTFKEKQCFYSGNKILVLGQVADLGSQAQELHDKLLKYILSSGADYIFGHGLYMRKVIKSLPAEKVGGWFDNAKDLAERIPYYCSNDSIVLLKGSVSGSDFRMTSHYLPNQLKRSKMQLYQYDPQIVANAIQPSWGVEVWDANTKEINFVRGRQSTRSLEGLGHLLLLDSFNLSTVNLNDVITLEKWPTNIGYSTNKKPFQKGTKFTILELINEFILTQHPSVIYQLGTYFYGDVQKAMRVVNKNGRELNLKPSSCYNLTGRYRVKEQQTYNLTDLRKLGYSIYKKRDIINFSPTLGRINGNEIKGLCFGELKLSCIAFYENYIISVSGVNTYSELINILSSSLQTFERKLQTTNQE